MKKVVVVGAAGHARVVLDALRLQRCFEIIGLIDNYKPLGFECGGFVVIGAIESLPAFVAAESGLCAVVAIGDNWTRARIVEQMRESCPGIEFVSVIHPSAQIASDVFVGPGTVIMAGVIVNSGSSVGEFCILNTQSSLDHDSKMDEFSSLGPASVTGGGVSVGLCSSVGMSATIVQGISIGRHTVIGAGALVLHSIPDQVVAYGVPARIIRPRQIGERYLGEISTAAGGK